MKYIWVFSFPVFVLAAIWTAPIPLWSQLLLTGLVVLVSGMLATDPPGKA